MRNNLKEHRTAVKMTQEVLARKANCTERAIRKYESGDQVPNIYIVIRMADALGIENVRELFPI